MASPETRAALEALDDEALRAEARARGFPVGRTLSRAQILDLLAGEDEEGGEAADAAAAPPGDASAFSTVTLARLYAQQGLEREAAVVCRSVLAARPGDARARRLLERLAAARRGGEASTRAQAAETRHRFPRFQPADAPADERAPEALPEHYGAPLCELFTQSPTTLYATWDVEPERERRARALAGERARRVLRLFSAWRGPAAIERRTRDVALGDSQRDAFVGACQAGAVHRAAVGWLGRGGRFVPVCHSDATETPVDEPCAPKRPTWRTLATPRLPAPSVTAAVRLIERLKGPRLSMALPWEGRGAGSGPVPWPAPTRPRPGPRPRPGSERGGSSSSWARRR